MREGFAARGSARRASVLGRWRRLAGSLPALHGGRLGWLRAIGVLFAGRNARLAVPRVATGAPLGAGWTLAGAVLFRFAGRWTGRSGVLATRRRSGGDTDALIAAQRHTSRLGAIGVFVARRNAALAHGGVAAGAPLGIGRAVVGAVVVRFAGRWRWRWTAPLILGRGTLFSRQGLRFSGRGRVVCRRVGQGAPADDNEQAGGGEHGGRDER
jgi:hypothetical protein